MTIYIRNILSSNFKALICNELNKAGVEFILNKTEEADTLEVIFPSKAEREHSLRFVDSDQRDERTDKLIKSLKAEILHVIYFSPEPLAVNLSVHLSAKFNYDYTYMASLFSNAEGLTIERFVIFNKIERVKKLLIYSDLSATEIALLMHYSSLAHLSAQFKKVTGITASQFRKLEAAPSPTAVAP